MHTKAQETELTLRRYHARSRDDWVPALRGYRRRLCSPESKDIAGPLEMKWPPELPRKKVVRAADFPVEGPSGDAVFVDLIRRSWAKGAFTLSASRTLGQRPLYLPV